MSLSQSQATIHLRMRIFLHARKKTLKVDLLPVLPLIPPRSSPLPCIGREGARHKNVREKNREWEWEKECKTQQEQRRKFLDNSIEKYSPRVHLLTHCNILQKARESLLTPKTIRQQRTKNPKRMKLTAVKNQRISESINWRARRLLALWCAF